MASFITLENYEDESSFIFARYPLEFWNEDSKFFRLSSGAKELYCFMLHRIGCSVKNQWVQDGRVYIILSINEASKILNLRPAATIKRYRELKTADLIEIKKRGQGKPSIIFLGGIDFIHTQNSEKMNSGISKSKIFEITKTKSINNNNSKNYFNSFDQSSEGTTDCIDIIPESVSDYSHFEIKMQIDYDYLLERGIEENTLCLIVGIIAAVNSMNDKNCFIRMGKGKIPVEYVKNQFARLNGEMIEYVLESIKIQSRKQKIKNCKQYLFSSLYHVVSTFDLDLELRVNYDLAK